MIASRDRSPHERSADLRKFRTVSARFGTTVHFEPRPYRDREVSIIYDTSYLSRLAIVHTRIFWVHIEVWAKD